MSNELPKVSTNMADHFNLQLRREVAIPIGSPAKPHRFDLVDSVSKVAIECKAFTWTKSGDPDLPGVGAAGAECQLLPADHSRAATRADCMESIAADPAYPSVLAAACSASRVTAANPSTDARCGAEPSHSGAPPGDPGDQHQVDRHRPGAIEGGEPAHAGQPAARPHQPAGAVEDHPQGGDDRDGDRRQPPRSKPRTSDGAGREEEVPARRLGRVAAPAATPTGGCRF